MPYRSIQRQPGTTGWGSARRRTQVRQAMGNFYGQEARSALASFRRHLRNIRSGAGPATVTLARRAGIRARLTRNMIEYMIRNAQNYRAGFSWSVRPLRRRR